ncbi:MAG: GlxA family transcriptional regulator [Rhodospirillales bacterium]
MAPRRLPVWMVVPPRSLLLDIAGPMEVLRKANLLQDQLAFDVHFVGPSPQAMTSIGLSVAGLLPLPDSLPANSLVVLSGATQDIMGAPPLDSAADDRDRAAIVAWLARTFQPGHRLISICSGALLAARAGLLDGYACTTHHGCCAELAALAPKARVLENRLFVEDRDCLTSAGVTAGIDLMLHVVSGLLGPAIAMEIARYLVVYLRRAGGDAQLSPWLAARNHLHPGIHRAQDLLSADPAKPWSVERLAREAGVSPRHLSRLFNRHAGCSLPDYLNGLRVALARDLVSQTRLDMENIAERAGFASTRQFRRAWGRLYDQPPSQFRSDHRDQMRPASGEDGSA